MSVKGTYVPVIITHQASKAYVAVEEQIHPFFTPTEDQVQQLAS